MSTVITYILLLTLPGAHGAAPANRQAAFEGSQLEAVLTKGAWVHEVRLGRVAIESRVLTFCGEGRVQERIRDDTGIHDLYGTWALEHADGGDILVLSGEHLRDRGRFLITYSEKERAFDLRLGSGDRTLRFRGVNAEPSSPCAPQN